MRYFNEQIVELLAPAGNFDIFKGIVKSKCDAIYFGGPALNMRLIRKGFNFSENEITQAVSMAHDEGKKVYITVNNLIDPSEIEQAKRYLEFLAEVGPDAVIVQDLGILKMMRQDDLPLAAHASVMMNVYNLPTVLALKRVGVSRVVLSRNCSLADISYIKQHADIEIEYFTHGDMCIAHGAQCYYSSMLFGMSSNRGKCLKPCRWWFSQDAADENILQMPDENKRFPLAVRDMCMYKYLPEMIHAGVNSFKIEGRMRDKDFIVRLVNIYGDALDRYIEDPIGWDPNENYKTLFDTRKRDFSTASAFGNSGAENLNTRWEGTGKFFSTGKMFSTPTPETAITEDVTQSLRERIAPLPEGKPLPKISVRVNNPAQATAAAAAGAHRIYAAGDVFMPDIPFSVKSLAKLKEDLQKISPETELYLGTPRMMNSLHLDTYKANAESLRPYIDGLLVGDLGAVELLKTTGFALAGDFSLNVLNGLAAEFLLEQGLCTVTCSVEMNAESLVGIAQDCAARLELIAYGRLEAMYFDHNFFEVNGASTGEPFSLYNEGGKYDIYMDGHHRTHLLTTRPFSLLPLLEEIQSLGLNMLRIEAQTETPEAIKAIVKAFNGGEQPDASACSYEAFRFK